MLRSRALLLCLAAAMLLAGCSALSLAYLNAPRLGTLWINRALDLPEAQREVLAEAAEEVYRWHLGAPRQELAGLLREAQRRLAGQVSASDGAWLVDRLQAHVVRLGEQLVARLAMRMPPFSPKDIARIEKRLELRRADYAEELTEGDREAQIRRRAETLEEFAQDWLGDLSEAQRALIAASPAVRGFDPQLWIAERARRERALVVALQAADGGASLRAWFVDWRAGRSPEVAALIAQQQRASIDLWVTLANQASETQRRHLRQRLGDWAEVFENAGS